MNSSLQLVGPALKGGKPNWQDKDAYGNVEDWDFERWRWEFKRRHAKLRFLYHELLKAHLNEVEPSSSAMSKTMHDSEFEEVFFYLSPANAAKWGYDILSNPLYSTRPDTREANEFVGRTIGGWHFEAFKRGEASWLEILGLGVAITFNPNAPLKRQLEGLEDYLLSLRRHDFPDDPARQRPDKWFTYLRIIDARDNGASWAECSKVLPCTSAGTPQSARDTYGQAIRIQSAL